MIGQPTWIAKSPRRNSRGLIEAWLGSHAGFRRPGYLRGVIAAASLKPRQQYDRHCLVAQSPRRNSRGLIEAGILAALPLSLGRYLRGVIAAASLKPNRLIRASSLPLRSPRRNSRGLIEAARDAGSIAIRRHISAA